MKNETPWTKILVLLVILLGPTLGVLTWKIVDTLDHDSRLMLSGALVALLFVVIITACWSGVVVAYSLLRRKEDEGEDKRDMELYRLASRQQDKGVQIHMQQPYGGTSGYVPPQQPQLATPSIEYIEEVDLS